MIADNPNKDKSLTRFVVDESLISPQGWVALDSTYSAPARSPDQGTSNKTNPVATVDDDILDLTLADVAAARSARGGSTLLAKQTKPLSRPSLIPARDIVPIGGAALRQRTPEQPFQDEPERANDNFSRFALLVVLFLSVVGGYAFTVLKTDDRRAIDVQQPDNALIEITMLERWCV